MDITGGGYDLPDVITEEPYIFMAMEILEFKAMVLTATIATLFILIQVKKIGGVRSVMWIKNI